MLCSCCRGRHLASSQRHLAGTSSSELDEPARKQTALGDSSLILAVLHKCMRYMAANALSGQTLLYLANLANKRSSLG